MLALDDVMMNGATVPFGGGGDKCMGMHFARMQAQLFVSELSHDHDLGIPLDYRPEFRDFPLPKIRDELPLQPTARDSHRPSR